MKAKKARNPTAKRGARKSSTAPSKPEPVLVRDDPPAWTIHTTPTLRAPAVAIPDGFELKAPKLEYVERGKSIVAKTCNDTQGVVQFYYPLFAREIDEVRKFVRINPDATPETLRDAFKSSSLAEGADEDDWQIWRDDFRQKSGSAKARSHALTFLKRKLGLEPDTIKTYFKRRKKKRK